MSFWTYMLRLSNGIYYTGHTDDLERRVAQHQSGEIKGYTHDRRPLELVWAEMFATRAEALEAELRVKNWSRDKKEALIASDWDKPRRAAMPPSDREARASTSLGGTPRLRSGRTETVGAGQVLLGVTDPPPPAIVLVRPQLGENIGQAARAMLNFGLTDLRLVAPRDGWPNPASGPAASGADCVLADARLFGTVADAVADCGAVFATTVRRRGLTLPAVNPAVAAARIRGVPLQSAILFGPERSGLETEDVATAGTIVTVPINPQFGSLNLAQAVILVAYEWSKAAALASPTIRDDLEPAAPRAELDGFIAQFDSALEGVGYFFPPDRTPTTRNTIRTMLTKPGWSSSEVRQLRGMLRAITDPKRPRGD